MPDAAASALPFGVLRQILAVAPDAVLVGSFAREYWVHHHAGLPRGPKTGDVDVSIAVESMDHYRARLAALSGPTGTGLVYRVAGWNVDVIPFGGAATNGVVSPSPGVTLDVTGMADTSATAITVTSGQDEVRVASLPAMIALKVVAWAYRAQATYDKDAGDLGPLLEATYCGPNNASVYADEAICDLFSYQEQLIGPYRAGLTLHQQWKEETVTAIADRLAGSAQATLASRIRRLNRSRLEDPGPQLDAFVRGLQGSP